MTTEMKERLRSKKPRLPDRQAHQPFPLAPCRYISTLTSPPPVASIYNVIERNENAAIFAFFMIRRFICVAKVGVLLFSFAQRKGSKAWL